MFFSPVLPEGVLLAAAWLFSVLFLFFFLLLAADAARLLYLLVLFCLRKKRTERFRIIGNRVNLVLLAFAAVLATVGMVGGTGVPRVKEETISVNHLPDGADAWQSPCWRTFMWTASRGRTASGKLWNARMP